MEIIWGFVKAFAVGGSICMIAQIVINFTDLTAGKILVVFMLAVPALQKSSAEKSAEPSADGGDDAAVHEICVSGGGLSLDGRKTDEAALRKAISDPAMPATGTITLAAAPGTPWSEVLPVMRLLSESGRSRVSFSVCSEGGS